MQCLMTRLHHTIRPEIAAERLILLASSQTPRPALARASSSTCRLVCGQHPIFVLHRHSDFISDCGDCIQYPQSSVRVLHFLPRIGNLEGSLACRLVDQLVGACRLPQLVDYFQYQQLVIYSTTRSSYQLVYYFQLVARQIYQQTNTRYKQT